MDVNEARWPVNSHCLFVVAAAAAVVVVIRLFFARSAAGALMLDSESAMLSDSASEIWEEDIMFFAQLAMPLIFNRLGLVVSSRPQDKNHLSNPSLGQK